jgi:hypothetical protein
MRRLEHLLGVRELRFNWLLTLPKGRERFPQLREATLTGH